MALDTLHLSIVDQNTARVYTQALSIFPFPDNAQQEAAVQALERGLLATLNVFPFFAGAVGPADPQTGRLFLAYPRGPFDMVKADLFGFSSIAYSDVEFPYTYELLKEDGMPPSVFTGKRFCPKALRNHPGIPPDAEGMMLCSHHVPALAVEAFFIPGGLILSSYFHHSVVDGSGMLQFWTHFAANVNNENHAGTSRSSPAPTNSISLTLAAVEIAPTHSAPRTQLDARIRPFHETPQADAYGVPDYEPTLPGRTPCSSYLFIISATLIREFRDQIQNTSGTITRCNVLAALIWIHVTRARQARLTQHGHELTELGIAVDLRRKIDPPLPATYMGNMALMAKATNNITDFSAEETVTNATIVPAVETINKTISSVDNAWVQRHLGYFRSIKPITNTEVKLKFNKGPDMYITSWMHFGADVKWNIPGTTSSSPEYIRRTYSASSDGGMIIMPRKRELVNGKEAPYEVLIRLASEDTKRLVDEPNGLARRWATRIIQ